MMVSSLHDSHSHGRDAGGIEEFEDNHKSTTTTTNTGVPQRLDIDDEKRLAGGEDHSSSKEISPVEELETSRDGDGGIELQHVGEVENSSGKLGWRTWVVVLVCNIAVFSQVFVVVSAPSVIAFIERDLGNVALSGWIVQAPILMQGALSPVVGRLSDLVDRKWLASIPPLIAVVGAIISAEAKSMSWLVGGGILIGTTLATISIVQAIPSEILPLKYRVLANGLAFISGGLGGLVGTMASGALTNQDPSGWRNIFWLQVGFHGVSSAGLILFYWPPPVDYPKMSFSKFFWAFDPIGSTLLVGGTCLALLAFDWTASYDWSDAHVVAPLVLGWIMLLLFGFYEWKGRSDGIAAHEFFRRGRNFALSVGAFAVEGYIFYSAISQFVPQIVLNLGWENNSWRIGIRQLSYALPNLASSAVVTWWSSRYKDVRGPLVVTFIFFLGCCIGYSTITPGSNNAQYGYNILAAIGQSGPLTLLVAVTQLSSPHEYLSCATGLAFSSRAVGGALGSAVMGAIVNGKLHSLPRKVGEAAVNAGLPQSSVEQFVTALTSGQAEAAGAVNGATSEILAAATHEMRWVYAHAYRLAWISIIPFVVLGIICVWLLKDMKALMTDRIEKSVEPRRSSEKTQEKA